MKGEGEEQRGLPHSHTFLKGLRWSTISKPGGSTNRQWECESRQALLMGCSFDLSTPATGIHPRVACPKSRQSSAQGPAPGMDGFLDGPRRPPRTRYY